MEAAIAATGSAAEIATAKSSETAVAKAASAAETATESLSAKSTETAETTCTAAKSLTTGAVCTALTGAFVKGCVTELVVQLTFLFIAQHLIRFGNFLKKLLCLGVVLIHVGVIFLCQLPVCLLDFRIRRRFIHAQNLIIVSFLCHVLYPSLLMIINMFNDTRS